MKEGFVIHDQEKIHYITCTVVDWIDVFTRQIYRDIVIDCFKYCISNKGMVVFGYVIMSNHIHIILQSKDGKLSDLVRDFKKFIAKNILEAIQQNPESRREWMLERFAKATETHTRNKNFQFWQHGNHAEEVYTLPFLWDKLNYIHLNPVRAGIVEKAQDYTYSSASNYVSGKGLMEIELAENPIIDTANPNNVLKFGN